MGRDMETELRSLVRELIRQVIPDLGRSPEVRQVTIATDDDLAQFVAQVVDLCEDRHTVERLRAGQLRFTLEPPVEVLRTPASSGGDPNGSAERAGGGPSLRIDKGAVTERLLAQTPDGTRVILGRAAVLTPLAREFARKKGITLERVP